MFSLRVKENYSHLHRDDMEVCFTVAGLQYSFHKLWLYIGTLRCGSVYREK